MSSPKNSISITIKKIKLEEAEEAAEEHRGEWGSNVEFFLACLGNMVGIGNVYRFPFLVYKNGGGAFLIPYLFFMFLMAIPILMLETTIGQYTQRGPVESFSNMFPILK
ncbi:hypothetical protein B4U79_06089, partial [Dinothrombium tinctorium]